MRILKTLLVLIPLFTALVYAQGSGKKTPSVAVAPVDTVSVTRGQGGPVTIHFRVPPGYHITAEV
jgi:hypothetical protein